MDICNVVPDASLAEWRIRRGAGEGEVAALRRESKCVVWISVNVGVPSKAMQATPTPRWLLASLGRVPKNPIDRRTNIIRHNRVAERGRFLEFEFGTIAGADED